VLLFDMLYVIVNCRISPPCNNIGSLRPLKRLSHWAGHRCYDGQ